MTTIEHLATKADLEKLASDLTWRIVLAMGAQTVVLMGFFTIMLRLVGR
jgi:hypothetical protein